MIGYLCAGARDAQPIGGRTVRTNAMIGAAVLALYAGQAHAQTHDPQSVLDSLIRRQFEEQARRDGEQQQQRARELFYARLSDGQVMQQLSSFCPTGAPACRQPPPELCPRSNASRSHEPSSASARHGLCDDRRRGRCDYRMRCAIKLDDHAFTQWLIEWSFNRV